MKTGHETEKNVSKIEQTDIDSQGNQFHSCESENDAEQIPQGSSLVEDQLDGKKKEEEGDDSGWED